MSEQKTVYVNTFNFVASNLDLYLELFQVAPKTVLVHDPSGKVRESEVTECVRVVMPHALAKEMAEKLITMYEMTKSASATPEKTE